MEKKLNLTTNVIILIIMASIAIIDNTKGIFIPFFRETFNASNTSMGVMLTVCSLGYIIFTYIGGILCEKLSQKKVMYIGLVSIIGSTLLIAVSKVYILLLIGMFFANMGIAFVMIGLNTLIPVLFIAYQAIMMNIAHCCYGLGSTIGQFSIGKIIDNGVSWRYVYLGIGILFLIVLLLVIKIKLPKVNYNEEKTLSLFGVFKKRYVYLYAIALGAYIFAEMGISNWMVNYLMTTYNIAASKGANVLATFFFLLTIGRLFGGFIAEKVGYLQSVMVSLGIAVILLFLGLILGDKLIILLCISGLFFSIGYPTIVATISKVFKNNSAYISGVILTMASTISMILNFIIGRLNDVIGTERAFYLIPVSLVISVSFILFIYIGKHKLFKRGGN